MLVKNIYLPSRKLYSNFYVNKVVCKTYTTKSIENDYERHFQECISLKHFIIELLKIVFFFIIGKAVLQIVLFCLSE